MPVEDGCLLRMGAWRGALDILNLSFCRKLIQAALHFLLSFVPCYHR